MTASANDPRKFFRGSVAISGGRISSVLPATPDNGSDDRGTESENRSRRVIEKLGFRYEGTLRRAHVRVSDGRVCDELCYSMTKEEYFGTLGK